MFFKKAKISVCMATYNGEDFIIPQLKSILAQLGPNDEVVVSDNYSNDKTIDLIYSLGDNRIKVIYCDKKLIVLNFENAIKLSTGNIIFLADQDDIWLPNKVKIMQEKLLNVDLVVSDCFVVDASLNLLEISFIKFRNRKAGLFNNFLRNNYMGCCMAFRRSLLQYALPFPESVPMHDWWLGMIAETFGRVAFIDEPLIMYRRHDSNASPTANKSKFNFIKIIKFRYILFFALLKRKFLIK